MVLYVVVGLSAVMLIVTAILMMIMALSCIHHKEKLSTLESQVCSYMQHVESQVVTCNM